MFRRLTSRRTLKWTGTIASALLIACAAAGAPWYFIGCSLGGWTIATGGGCTYVLWDSDYSWGGWAALRSEVAFDWKLTLSEQWATYGLWPRTENSFVSVPLWMPFALIGIPTALLWRADRRRPRAGCCRKCDYDLTGNVSGRCPECGSEMLKSEERRAKEDGGGDAAGV